MVGDTWNLPEGERKTLIKTKLNMSEGMYNTAAANSRIYYAVKIVDPTYQDITLHCLVLT